MRVYLPRNVGVAVRKRRTDMGLRQLDLAARGGVSEKTIVSLESGSAPDIRLDKLMGVLDALGPELHITGFEEGQEPELLLVPNLEER